MGREEERGIEEKRRDEAENARLCRETAVLGGDAVARAKVGSEGGVEVAAKTGGSGGGGYETAFLKMRVGALVAPRVAGGGRRAARRKSTVRGLWKETITVGRRGNSPGLRER